MSGICGMVGSQGAPADAARVERMTSWLTKRGPDGRATWKGAHASLGHALLDTTDGKVRDEQPATLDGHIWVVADVRLDDREALVRALRGCGEDVKAAATDAQLILHAWRAWREDCTAHLRGDFAFALWDAPTRTLHCARDHLGVKPFFYVHGDDRFVFASALDCLRREGGAPDTLDELAIADFLLFEMPQDPGATVFSAIRRLPPAHSLTLDPHGLRLRRYWRLPAAQVGAPRTDREWLEQFDDLLQRATADRLTSSRVSVLMSGGLDSPAVAACALRGGADVKAFSSAYDRIIPDEERHFSTVAARFLGVPISHRALDDYGFFERYRELAFHFAEPVNAPFAAADLDLYADAAAHSRVVLTGWDGDALLSETPRTHFALLARERQWARLARVGARFAVENPRSVARSLWIRAMGRAEVKRAVAAFPEWLAPDFVARHRLRERFRDARTASPCGDPLRPTARRTFEYYERLANFFEAVDANRTGLAVEMRHPLYDLRVIEFCLSLPVVPWCVDKRILRDWLRGRVPEAIRRRPKTPLAGFPHLEAPERQGSIALRSFAPQSQAAQYVDRGKITSMAGERDPAISWELLRAPALDLWFRHARAS